MRRALLRVERARTTRAASNAPTAARRPHARAARAALVRTTASQTARLVRTTTTADSFEHADRALARSYGRPRALSVRCDCLRAACARSALGRRPKVDGLVKRRLAHAAALEALASDDGAPPPGALPKDARDPARSRYAEIIEARKTRDAWRSSVGMEE